MAQGIYRGVSSVARKVTKMYRGVSAVARQVKAGYRGVSSVARQFYSGTKTLTQTGIKSFNGWEGGETKTISVTFETPFIEIPTVTFEKLKDSAEVHVFDVSITNITKTGLKIVATNNTGGGWSVRVEWTATGIVLV